MHSLHQSTCGFYSNKKPLPAVTGVVRHSNEVNQMNTNNLSNQQQIIQSWFEPALHTLKALIKKCEENLERIKADTKNAAVKRDDFKENLVLQHRITYNHAEEIIKSLGRAGRIRFLGSSYIQIKEGGEA
nr:transposase [Acinetobacter baumannii]